MSVRPLLNDGTTDDDGIDLGWVTTSSKDVAMTVTHMFSGVAGGKNASIETESGKGSDKALVMTAESGVIIADDDGADADNGTEDDIVACLPVGDYEMTRDGHFRPEECFRLIGPGAGMKRQRRQTRAPTISPATALSSRPWMPA